jgi:phosphatidylinositol alpha-1,6-mannosyltransferase
MKILITIDFPPENGGIQKYLHERVLHLYNSENIIISGSSSKFSGPLPCRIFQFTVFSHFNKKLNLIPIFFILLIFLCRYKTCTIEAGNIYGAIPAFLLSFIFRSCRYIIICHGLELMQLQSNSFKSVFLKAVLKRSTQQLVVSKFTLDLIRKAGIIPDYCYVPPRIDLSQYERCAEPYFEKGEVHILSVGRLLPHKGHSILLEAAAMLPKSIPYKLTIAGDGPLYNSLSKKCRNEHPISRATIVKNPTHDELYKLYQEANLFVFPSLNLPDGVEGFGIVLLEAMAFRIPIIASDTGGIPEVVTPECAVLVPPGDSAALCRSIAALCENPILRKQLAQKAFERVETHFSWK